MSNAEQPTAPTPSGERPILRHGPIFIATLVPLVYCVEAWTFTAFLTAGLFSLTLAIDVAVLRRRNRIPSVSWKLGAFELLKVLLFAAYAVMERQATAQLQLPAEILSGFALFLGIGLTLGLIDTARKMIRTKTPEPNSRLWELLTDKVLALTGLVIAFLHITYALTFALAFSDRFAGGQLYAVKIGPEAEPKTADSKPADCAEAPACFMAEQDRMQKFFFAESAATLPCTERFDAAAREQKALQKAVCSVGLDARVEAFRNVTGSGCDEGPNATTVRRAAAWNVRELFHLRSRLRQLSCDGSKSHLIEIRGHANDTRLKIDPLLAYGSNYEISKQRADQVALLLNSMIRDAANGVGTPAIRLLPYGVSNEPSFLDPNSLDWAEVKLDKKLSVEVHIQNVADSFEDRHLRDARTTERKLALIDYLYFTVYTITTTGYGDIMPTSSYSKFIVTLANLIELLFVVVLVNVIANTKVDLAAPEDASKGENHADRI